MINTYLISGLGADRTAFRHLHLPEYVKVNYVEWIQPENKESLQHYCKRLAEQINVTEPFILIGLSFGGIVAVEIARTLKPQKIIIISSISNCNELPWYYQLIGSIQLHKLVPTFMLKSVNAFMYWIFGAKTEEEKTLLTDYIRNVDEKYLRWSIDVVLNWKNEVVLPKLVHIHGTIDKIFPIQYVQPDFKIERGEHLMVLSKADEINKILTGLVR